jgi:hypothetical protein
MLPGRAYFLSGAAAGQEGDSQAEIYDTTAMQARRGLATAIDGLMKPSTSQWSWMKSQNDDLNDDEACKRYFDAVDLAMRRSIYNPLAQFIPQSNCVDSDIATFGIGYLYMGERRDKSGLSFKSLFIGDVAIDENADGAIDTAYICRRFTARQAAQIWKGEGQLGPKVREALESTNKADKDKKFEFVECITPRHDYDSRKKDNKNLPFSSEVVCVEDDHIVEESGYHEFPIACPRWELVPGQVYPRSPGMLALPDARTLQAMGKTMLVAGEYAADPARWIVDDGSMSVLRAFPGGHNVVSIDTVQATNGNPIGTLDMGGNLPITLEMQESYRASAEAAFFKNVLGLPVNGPEMTATESMIRQDEYIRMIGPVAGQLQSDYPGAIVPRVFGIMSRASYANGKRIPGAPFPEIPEQLQNSGARFEYLSPIQKAAKRREQTGLTQSLMSIETLVMAKPEMLDNLDVDAIMRDMPDGFGFPEKYLLTTEKVAEMRSQRAQEAQVAKLLEAGQGAADILKTGADAGASAAKAGAQVPA